MSPIKSMVRKHGRLCQLAVAVIGSLLCTAAVLYCTAKWSPVPAGADSNVFVLGSELRPGRQTAQSGLAPFLHIVPSEDGAELYVTAGGVGQLGGEVAVNLGVGQGCHKGSWTMVYSDTNQTYAAIVPGLNPSVSAYAPLHITTTLGLGSDLVEFYRAPVPAATTLAIQSRDGHLELRLISTDTIPSDTYVVVVPSYAPPGPVPPGHQLVGNPYSVRAAGALITTTKQMGLSFYYGDLRPTDIDPHMLATFAWYSYYNRWQDLGGVPNPDFNYHSVATNYFTTYALMATPSWRDEFHELSGLKSLQNVTWRGGADHHLYLASAPGSGSALSQLITPPAEFAHWDTLTFAATADLPTTTLTVDVLDGEGAIVLAGVESGVDLSNLDAEHYPELVLRVNMTSTVGGETPILDAWRLSWQTHTVYLPQVIK